MQGPEYLEVDGATVSCVDGSEADEVNPPGQYQLIIDCSLKVYSTEKSSPHVHKCVANIAFSTAMFVDVMVDDAC